MVHSACLTYVEQMHLYKLFQEETIIRVIVIYIMSTTLGTIRVEEIA